MNRREIYRWEMAGAAFVIIAGSALHFVFEWSGGFRPVAWLAAVNESTWEHFKLGFWPALSLCLGGALRLEGEKARKFLDRQGRLSLDDADCDRDDLLRL